MSPKKKNKPMTTAQARAIIQDRMRVAAARGHFLPREAKALLEAHIIKQGDKPNHTPCARCGQHQQNHALMMCAEPGYYTFGKLMRLCKSSAFGLYDSTTYIRQAPCTVVPADEVMRPLEQVIRESIHPKPAFVAVEPTPTFWKRFRNFWVNTFYRP